MSVLLAGDAGVAGRLERRRDAADAHAGAPVRPRRRDRPDVPVRLSFFTHAPAAAAVLRMPCRTGDVPAPCTANLAHNAGAGSNASGSWYIWCTLLSEHVHDATTSMWTACFMGFSPVQCRCCGSSVVLCQTVHVISSMHCVMACLRVRREIVCGSGCDPPVAAGTRAALQRGNKRLPHRRSRRTPSLGPPDASRAASRARTASRRRRTPRRRCAASPPCPCCRAPAAG